MAVVSKLKDTYIYRDHVEVPIACCSTGYYPSVLGKNGYSYLTKLNFELDKMRLHVFASNTRNYNYCTQGWELQLPDDVNTIENIIKVLEEYKELLK